MVSGRRMAEVAASRERAVERILGGGLLGLAGGGACMLAESAVLLPELASLGLAVGGLVLAGSGCVVIGLAASHLVRFGGGRGMGILAGIGGVGVSVLTWTLGVLLGSPGAGLAGSLGFVASVGLVVLMVAGLLVEYAQGRGGSTPPPGAAPPRTS